ncbi:MAG TPA: DinB family protein [Fimbriimonadaceae bacterium]|nr:DinB family protein [Fimbriimonadaceae bacterium]
MDTRAALKEQYHAGLRMLAECVEKCPEDLWHLGEHPRPFWRIAWHTLYFTHNYLDQTQHEFNASVENWPGAIKSALGVGGEKAAIDVEPYELPEGATAVSKPDMLVYLEYIDALVDQTVDGLDLDRQDTGYEWYPGMTKLSHQLMNLRHLQGHVGQLSELLMMRGIDTAWVAKA